jgi:hypothetical protein
LKLAKKFGRGRVRKIRRVRLRVPIHGKFGTFFNPKMGAFSFVFEIKLKWWC